jgi:hypothetical protein
VGIDQLLHSSCYSLNTNTAIMQQPIRTARTLEAEWWQVHGEVWVRRQRKMSQVLGAFGLLDFTMLRPVLAWRALWNLWTIYFFNFPNSKLRIRTGIYKLLGHFWTIVLLKTLKNMWNGINRILCGPHSHFQHGDLKKKYDLREELLSNLLHCSQSLYHWATLDMVGPLLRQYLKAK